MCHHEIHSKTVSHKTEEKNLLVTDLRTSTHDEIQRQ